MSDFLTCLRSGPLILADGAMGTMLQQRGLPPGEWSARWSLSHPEQVSAVHRAYVAAGSEVVLTNSFGAHERAFSAAEVAAINAAAVRLARDSGARWVAGSLGPGAGMSQVTALASAGVDLFWLETQLGRRQAVDTIATCRASAPGIPIIVTFSFHRADGRTQLGEEISHVAAAMETVGVAAVGLNCGNGLAGVCGVVEALAGATSLPLVVKPNAGLPHPTEASAWAAELRAALIPQVRLLGGCCGATPDHLATLQALLQNGSLLQR
jgi:5-methyltetrahydrofolate--homocysteine methyltransferase